MEKATEQSVCQWISSMIFVATSQSLYSKYYPDVESFSQRGIQTSTAGLVLTLDDGSEFQVSVVQSKLAEE